MPHQCTGCGHTFADGSKEMLSGCPECGGNKFQFRPEGASLPDDPSEPEPPEAEEPPEPGTGSSSVAETVGRATTRVRDFVSSDPEATPDPEAAWPSESDPAPGKADADSADRAAPTPGDADDIIDADARRDERNAEEDVAQASARTDVVSADELDDVGGTQAGPPDEPPVDAEGEVVSEPSEDDPDLTELREQLNDQFESIKILEPGQYELNLMELYDREEYIIALQENGRYVIQVPEQWIGEEPGDR
jgi:predicted  nucleic acid-binding Zn-ribbon protein